MRENKHITSTALGTLTVGLGLLCLAASVIFGLVQTVKLSRPDTEAPNIAGAGAACGLGIAAGLCFVAAALAEIAGQRPEIKNSDPAGPVDQTPHS